MESTSHEEPGKKRDSAQVEYFGEEKSKKVRVQRDRSARNDTHSQPATSTNNTQDTEYGRSTTTAGKAKVRKASTKSEPSSSSRPRIWDMESALVYLAQGEPDEKKEFLSNKRNAPWVTFRVGHSGDASTIANWYRQSTLMDSPEPELEVKTPLAGNSDDESQDEPSRSSELEVWLADGLGDEDNPPAVYALIAQVHEEQEADKVTTLIGAVALFTPTWERGERVLRIPWIHFDSRLSYQSLQLLERRTWLRISTLSQMTACQAIVVDEKLTSAAGTHDDEKNQNPSPCAE